MKQKVSLVLSGGGARGMAHIGVIEELEKEGYEISSVAGTSMGAVVGGIYALGKLEEYKNWLYTLDKMKISGLVDFAFSVEGFVKGDKLFNTIKKFVPDTNIEDLRIPFAAVAADIINKKEIVFTSGSVFDAVRASMAIPTVLTPVKTENGLLVDGGIINNLPLNHVKRTPHDILIAVNVNADIPVSETFFETKDAEAKQSIYQKKISEIYNQFKKVKPLSREEKLGYFDVINKTLNLVAHHITQMSLEKYSPDILIDISRDICGAFDFHRAEEMVEIGRSAAIKSLEAYKSNKNKALDKHLG